MQAAAVAHGGVGSDEAHVDGCRAAVDAALAVLQTSGDPVAAAVAGVVVLEDDPRFQAGTGATVRLDGSIQMDASVMSSDGRFTAVAGLERVKNPVRVAEALRATPHLLLVGDGATQFARALGHPEYDPGTPARHQATQRLREQLAAADPSLPAFWRGNGWRGFWNYPQPPAALGLGPAELGSDTVGVVVRAADGRYAGALSTGGMTIMLRGRVGDVPLFGAGLFAGPAGAAAATGVGERITEVLLAHTVYGWIAQGMPAAEAARRGVDMISSRTGGTADTGLIVVTSNDLGAFASASMATAGRTADQKW
jgi:isoaspartyl peptidase/L-asparaginase-like protein (Ntn-hydrolase superfamily)